MAQNTAQKLEYLEIRLGTRRDPLLQQALLVIRSSGRNHTWIARHSGVTMDTLYRWETGKTRCPHIPTLRAVLRTLGYELVIRMERVRL